MMPTLKKGLLTNLLFLNGFLMANTVGICNPPFKIPKHLKSRLFEDGISNSWVFKGSGYNYSYGPNHLKTGSFKIWTFLLQMVFDKMAISLSEFKMFGLPCKPFSFRPFKIRMGPDSRPPLYPTPFSRI